MSGKKTLVTLDYQTISFQHIHRDTSVLRLCSGGPRMMYSKTGDADYTRLNVLHQFALEDLL